jgi:CheY-like chemotaxis protein
MSAAQSHPGAHGVILVVDDEPAVRRLIARVLQREGFVAQEAEDGWSAMAHLEATAAPPSEQPAVSLVLTDIHMPRMDGVELTRAVRGRWPRLPIVLMTGNLVPDGIHRISPTPPIVTKPLQFDHLVDRIREALQQHV